MEVFAALTPTSSGNSKAFLEALWDENARHARALFAGLAQWDADLLAGFEIAGREAIDLDNGSYQRAHALTI